MFPPRSLRDREGVYNVSVIDYLLNQTNPEIVIFDAPAPKIVLDQLIKRNVKFIGAGDPGGWSISPTAIKTKDRLIALDGWFNGQDIVGPFGYHVAFTRLLPGGKGIGPQVKMPGVISYYSFHRSAFKADLASLESALRQTSYRGPVTGYAELGGSSILYWTGGFTPCHANFLEVLRTPISKFFVDIVNAVPTATSIKEHIAIAIRMSTNDWPARAIDASTLKLEGVNEHNLKHFYTNDLMQRDGVYMTSAQGDGDLGLLTARGTCVREAARRLLRSVQNVAGTDTQYRFDILDETRVQYESIRILDGLLSAAANHPIEKEISCSPLSSLASSASALASS
jgi:hypothetical protein